MVDGAAPGQDAELLYWAAASLGLAISVSKRDASLLARLPEVRALHGRALEIDESWNRGTLHELSITLAASPGGGRDREAMSTSFERALELSQGTRASLFVVYAEAFALPVQDRGTFEALLDRALSVDLDASPDDRFMNTVSIRRARWLLARTDELFLE